MTDLEQLARHAVACKHWRWMPGMLAWSKADEYLDSKKCRLIWEKLGYEPGDWAYGRWYMSRERVGRLVVEPDYPDLSDPATLGCFMALLREASSASKPKTFNEQRLLDRALAFGICGNSYSASLLVAALEAAGGER